MILIDANDMILYCLIIDCLFNHGRKTIIEGFNCLLMSILKGIIRSFMRIFLQEFINHLLSDIII